MGQYLSNFATISAQYPVETIPTATKDTDNESSDKLTSLPNIQCKVLINAYIFQIEKELASNTIIPDTIISLCLDYYDSEQLMYSINIRCGNLKDNVNKMWAMNMAGDQMWPCQMYALFPNETVVDLNVCVGPQYVLKRNVRLPPAISYQMNINCTHIYNQCNDHYTIQDIFDIVFVSEARASYALIIDRTQNYRENNSLIVFPWTLKEQSQPYVIGGSGAANQCTASTFSNKYGLIEFKEFSGKTTGQYLRLNGYEDGDNWKWNTMPVNMIDHHISTTAMLEDNDKLVALGGNFPMELYDFNSREWDSLANPNLFPSTCCYDAVLNCLYVSDCINRVDYYDFMKDKWFELPNTCNSYYENAAMWKQYNLLYIATSLANPIEFIDVRQKKKWQICKPALTETIDTIFDRASAVKYIAGQ